MAEFDASAAKAAGYSDAEIARVQQGIASARAAGYSDDEIGKFLASGSGRQSVPGTPSPVSAPARIPLGLGTDVAEGIATGLGLPGDLESLGVRYIANPVNRFLGLPAEDPTNTLFPTSQKLTNYVRSGENALGVPSSAALAPQGPVEGLVRAGVRGVAAAAPLTLTGAIVPTLVGGGLGGVASEGAKELGAPPAVQMGAGLIAGGAGTAAANVLGRNVNSVARSLGNSSSLQEAGIELQDAARGWMTSELPTRLANAWAPVDALIAPNTDTALTNFQSTLGRINTSAGTLQPLAERLRPQLPKTLGQLVTRTPAGLGNPVPWQDVQVLRTTLGDAMTNPKIVNDIGRQNMDALYKALSEDMRTAASNVSPDALDAFNSANAQSTALYGFAERNLGRIITDANNPMLDPRPEDVAKRLLVGGRRGGTDLAALRAEIPEGVDELAAAHLRLNPDAREWGRLSPEAQEALVVNPRDRAIVSSAVPKKGTPSLPTKLLETMTGSFVGDPIGKLAGPLLGVNPLISGAAGDIVGAALPWVLGSRTVRNPLTTLPAYLGAESNQPLASNQ